MDMDMVLGAGFVNESYMPLHQWLPLVAYTDGYLINTLVFLESVRFQRQINLDPSIRSSPFRFPYPEETQVLFFSAHFHSRASSFYHQALLKRERDGAEKLSLSRNIPLAVKSLALFLAIAEGLKFYDVEEGKGPVATKGSTAQVHFDCRYRSITAISTRESKLLAGNRSIAQPYEFKVGSTPGKERKREFVDNPNGLFSAQASPKPPPAMYYITEGMKVGGKRTVIVPPEAGYGQKGMNEIPPGATFELNIELLQVTPPEEK